jgi:hypothetical protein
MGKKEGPALQQHQGLMSNHETLAESNRYCL